MPVRWWVGAVLVALGATWVLDAAGVLDAGPFLADWWPAALVALALLAVLTERRVALGPVVLLVVGVVLLLGTLGLVAVGAFVVPVLLVLSGVRLLLGGGRRRVGDGRGNGRGDGRGDASAGVADRQNALALLGGSEVRPRSEHFRHADVSAVLGGVTLDLRQARLAPGARVDALAVFGGVDVVVPRGWRVSLSGLPVFGGCEDKTVQDEPLPEDAPVLQVVATAVFGGVGVKNTPGDQDQRSAVLHEDPHHSHREA